MSNRPPYTITEAAADYLAKITEAVTRLEFGTDFKRDIKLHRVNRVRTIYSSLAIEGNSLTEDDVAAVIGGRTVAGKQVEIKEVKNAYEAYDQIMTYDPYSIKDFLKAHGLMTQGLVDESGKFRSGNVGVFGSESDEAIHFGARPQFVPNLMTDLFAWAKESDLHPLLKSGVLHYEIETIHPFSDGNGRMGRLWQTLLLSKWNELFSWIPMESVINDKKQEYYDAIESSRHANDSGAFIEYTLSALYESVMNQLNPPEEPVVKQESPAEVRIIEYLSKNPKATKEQIADATNISSTIVELHIKALSDRGRMKRSGDDNDGYWKILDEEQLGDN